MKTQLLVWGVVAALTLVLLLSMAACAVTDPVLRQAIADVGQRPERARLVLRRYAERGEQAAIAPLCVAYGRSLDYSVGQAEREQAFAWCTLASKAGHAEAQYHLGLFYKSGIGTREDPDAALQWFRSSAGQGHREAENEARGLEGKPRLCSNLITGCRLF